MRKYFLIGISFLISNQLLAQNAPAFGVQYFAGKIKVISPNEFVPKTSVIIENLSESKLYGHIRTKNKILHYAHIAPGEKWIQELSLDKNEQLQFVPVSPPYEKVDLIFGKGSYEIPPAK